MRVALITGAAGGIGFHLATAFANNNFQVIAVDNREIVFKEKNICFYKADLQNEKEITELFNYMKKTYSYIHILINNAAASMFGKNINKVTIDEFDRTISVNLRASFICCKEFITLNQGQDYGRIINISSTRFHQNEADWECYGITKGGIVSLTNSLCVSLSDTPITVNAISPGWIQTSDYDKLNAEDHKQHPSGRVGKPEDIAIACLFLCEAENDFINGANLIIDGGMTKKMIYL